MREQSRAITRWAEHSKYCLHGLAWPPGAPRSASVTDLRDSTLCFVNKPMCFVNQADFDAIGKSNPEIYHDVMKVLARRLRDTNIYKLR